MDSKSIEMMKFPLFEKKRSSKPSTSSDAELFSAVGPKISHETERSKLTDRQSETRIEDVHVLSAVHWIYEPLLFQDHEAYQDIQDVDAKEHIVQESGEVLRAAVKGTKSGTLQESLSTADKAIMSYPYVI